VAHILLVRGWIPFLVVHILEVTPMTEKELETRLPSSEEILAAYEKLFGDNRSEVQRFKQSGVQYVPLSDGMILVEQNQHKESHWAKMAREGHKIAWLIKGGEFLARVIDGKVDILHHD
jgi:hypothetical protein